jgi:hypothetical protein
MSLWPDAGAAPAAGKEGLIAEGVPGIVESFIVQTAAVRAGFVPAYGGDRATTRNQIQALPALPGVDVDAIAVDLPSGAAAVSYTAIADLDGAIGIQKIYPPMAVTMNFNANVAWDNPIGFSIHTVRGEDADGQPISEDVIRNNTGGAAVQVVTRQCYSRVSRVDVGAGAGAGGTLNVGVDPTLNEIGRLDFPGIVAYDPAREASQTAAVTFDVGETCACLRSGSIWAACVNGAAAGDPVFVRTTAGGGVLRGALYGPVELPAGGAFGRLLHAHWKQSVAALGLGIVEVGE